MNMYYMVIVRHVNINVIGTLNSQLLTKYANTLLLPARLLHSGPDLWPLGSSVVQAPLPPTAQINGVVRASWRIPMQPVLHVASLLKPALLSNIVIHKTVT